MQTNMLGDNETLRRLWCGPFLDLAMKFNGGKGPEFEEQVNKLLRGELMPIPQPAKADGIAVVKTSVIVIGGGRTTDQIIADANSWDNKTRPSYINPEIKQVNTPAGHGRKRSVIVEWFQFGHDPTTEEVRSRCEESGYGYSTYEDGLRFQEDHPDDQRQRPHIIVPENPWTDSYGNPQALNLWSYDGRCKLRLIYCYLDNGWSRRCLFARRKY